MKCMHVIVQIKYNHLIFIKSKQNNMKLHIYEYES